MRKRGVAKRKAGASQRSPGDGRFGAARASPARDGGGSGRKRARTSEAELRPKLLALFKGRWVRHAQALILQEDAELLGAPAVAL